MQVVGVACMKRTHARNYTGSKGRQIILRSVDYPIPAHSFCRSAIFHPNTPYNAKNSNFMITPKKSYWTCFCLLLPRHVVISVFLLDVNCGKPLVAYSDVINKSTAHYHYKATVRMSCYDGYKRVKGSYFLRCLANGKWNATSLRCKRKWSSGVRYYVVRFCVSFFFFFWTKSNSTTDSSSCCKLFSFSPVEMKCLWQEARVHEAPQASKDKRTHRPGWFWNGFQTSTRKRAILLQFILKRWTSLGQLMRSPACTDHKRSILRGHTRTKQVDFEVDGQSLHQEIILSP